MKGSGLSARVVARFKADCWAKRPVAQFRDEFISACNVKWTRRRHAPLEEASPLDALMQLPRHCRVSPPAPTYNTDTHTPSHARAERAGARATQVSLISSSPCMQARSRSPGNSSERTGLYYHCRATWASSTLFI